IDDYAQAIDNLPSGGGMTYEDYARTLYLIWGKSSQFTAAWARSLIVNPSEIGADTVPPTPKGKNQYPNGDTEGVIIPYGVTRPGNYSFYGWPSNNQPLVIPDSVTSIGNGAFQNWTSNNQPLVIPDSVTSIGNDAFEKWESNNLPLVIPDSVTSIGERAFERWTSNNHPIVIPDSVTSIGSRAFQDWLLVPYVEMKSVIPPTLGGAV